MKDLIQEAVTGRWADLKDPLRHHTRATRIADQFPDLRPTDFPARQGEVVSWLRNNGCQTASSVNRYLSILSTLGFKCKFLKESRNKEPRVLTTEELEQLDANVRAQSDAYVIHKALYGMLWDSGARGIEEIRRLDLTGADWTKKTFILDSFKGKYQARVIPMTDITSKILAWYYHNGLKVPSPGSWRAFWLRVRLDPQNKPYDLRHTFCPRLLQKGVAPAVVQRIMGHSNLEQTLHYFHITPEALESARAALE
jgi:integrase